MSEKKRYKNGYEKGRYALGDEDWQCWTPSDIERETARAIREAMKEETMLIDALSKHLTIPDEWEGTEAEAILYMALNCVRYHLKMMGNASSTSMYIEDLVKFREEILKDAE